MKFNSTLGAWLCEKRKIAGFSIIDVADHLGKSSEYIESIESGNRVIASHELTKLVALYGASSGEVLAMMFNSVNGKD